MIITTSFDLDLNHVDLFYNLLKEEDFDFKNKNIKFIITKSDNKVIVDINCSNILELKIASSALIKSLEIINKTLEI